MTDPTEPTPDQVAAALDALVAHAGVAAMNHGLSADLYPRSASLATWQKQMAGAFTEAARLVRLLTPNELPHEWKCPACGATTRARMADHPKGGQ